MPGNPVRRKPEIEVDLSAIPGHLTPAESRARAKEEKAALEAYKASMNPGDWLDAIRTPFNVMSNSMAGLGAEMIGKGKEFEAKYGWMPKTRAEMEAVETLMKYMEPVIDTMDRLKVPPIVGPNTPTLAAALQGFDRTAARLTAEQAARAAANAGQATKGAVKDLATSDAAYNLANKVASASGAAPKQIMMGPMSKTWRKADADLAVQMESEGRSANDIWRKTGTFRAPDGRLRQEIPDIDMRYTSGEVEKKQYGSARKRYEQAKARATTPEELNDANDYWNRTKTDAIFNLTGKAPDFVNHPELFAAYPELAKYAFKQLEPTHSQFTAPETVYGFYSPTKQRITINTDAPYKRSTALHELQHAIQEIEGWQGGSSPEYVAAKMAERDVAKKEAKNIQGRIDYMKETDPVLYEDLIKNEESALGAKQYLLNQTQPLEGVTDPYEAYKKMSGEEEARMVQARRDYDERSRRDSLPIWNYETPPSEQITKDFAAGGEVHMGGGGKVGILGAMARTAEKGMERAMQGALPQVNRIDMHYKDVGKRVPELTEAAQRVARGEATAADYDTVVNKFKPVAPYSFVPAPATTEDAMRALNKTKRLMYGKTSEIQPGEIADLRLDIPSYQNHGVWINSIHRDKQPTVYGSYSSVKNARMFGAPDRAFRVATGEAQKGPWATISGEWNPMDEATAVKNAQQYLTHEDWRQVGYDPERHGYFYDRHTMEPVTGAEEVLQIGPLVLAKKPVYGVKAEQKFSGGGRTGVLGAIARTAEKGMERVAKAAIPVAQRAIVGAQDILPTAEREANLAKFLAPSKSKNRLYHGTNSDFSVFDASRAGKNTDDNASSEAYAQTARLGHWLNSKPMAGPKAGYDVDMPVYVSIQNPKREMSLDWLAQRLEGTTGQEYRDRLIKKGYDGIRLPDEEFGGESWVAFTPEQIKSALGNRGTYDINDPDINKADGGKVTIDAFLKRMKEK
jgi:hypothetical protein